MPTWLKWGGGFVLLGGMGAGGEARLKGGVALGLAIALSLAMIWGVMTALLTLGDYWASEALRPQVRTGLRSLRWLLCGLGLLWWLLWLVPPM